MGETTQTEPNIRVGPRAPFLLTTLAHDELCSNSNSNFHHFFICSSGIIRLGFVSSHSLALQVRIYRISCCRVIRSWWYPSLLSRLKCISLGVDTQSGISTNPAHPTITQILALVPIFGSNLSGYPQRIFFRCELIKSPGIISIVNGPNLTPHWEHSLLVLCVRCDGGTRRLDLPQPTFQELISWRW